MYVGGKSDARLNVTVPEPVPDSTNLALAVTGASGPVLSVTVYFFHSPVTGSVLAKATTALPSSTTMAAVTGPAKPCPPLA